MAQSHDKIVPGLEFSHVRTDLEGRENGTGTLAIARTTINWIDETVELETVIDGVHTFGRIRCATNEETTHRSESVSY